MPRLRTARSPDPDDTGLEGFDRLDLEGEAIGPLGDELPWLRPFGALVPGLVLGAAGGELEPEATRVPRLSRELAAAGRRLDAILLLRRYVHDAPRDAATRTLLAQLLLEAGEPEEALAELTQALGHSTDPVPVLVRRGALLASLGQTEDAERDLLEAVNRQPGFAPAQYHLGVALYRRGRGAEAAVALRKALEAEPDDPDAAYHLGLALQAQGDHAGALSVLERAAGHDPDPARCFKQMGRLLDRMGRTDEAMAMHRKAREAATR